MSEVVVAEVHIDETDKRMEFRSWASVIRFLKAERTFWDWLTPGDPTTDEFGVASRMISGLDQILQNAETSKNQNQPIQTANDLLKRFAAGGDLTSHVSPKAIRIADIRAASGDKAAAYALGLERREINLSNASSLDHLRGAMLSAFPHMVDPVRLATRLNRERATFRAALQSITQRLESERLERDRDAMSFLERTRAIAVRALRSRSRFWSTQRDDWQERADAAVESIAATENTYKEAMKLQASVEYWRNKAENHGFKEGDAVSRLRWFFPISLIVMTIAFFVAGWVVLRDANEHHGNVPTALYVILSGGLAVLTTMIFWIGRLFTKLYLSEHHLRNDSEERAVMTTTYLALTKEHAAEETDRQIVLSALFRNTPDGIVKDDGPTDASLQAVIAKLLAR